MPKASKRKTTKKKKSPMAHLASKVHAQGVRIEHIEHKLSKLKGRGKKHKRRSPGRMYSPAVEAGVVYED